MRFRYVIPALLAFLSALTAHASLTYFVDAQSHVLTLNGTATGSPGHFLARSEIRWGTDNLGEEEAVPEGEYVEATLDDNGNAVVNLSAYSVLTLHHILLNVHAMFGDLSSITFSELRLDYSKFSQSNRNYIDSLAHTQETLRLSMGSEYGNIVYAAVPEPAQAGLLFSGAVLAVLLARRRGRR